MKTKHFLLVFLILVLASSFVSAGFFSNLKSLFQARTSNQNRLQPSDNMPSYQGGSGRQQIGGQQDNVAPEELQFSVLYKDNEAPHKIKHYMDFVGISNDFMIFNTNLEQLFVSALYNNSYDNLFELNLAGDSSWIKTKWKISNNQFSSLGYYPATEEAGELLVFDLMQLVADGQTDHDVELSSGLRIKNPDVFGNSDEVRLISAPANEQPASGLFKIEYDPTSDLSDVEGYDSNEKALHLFTSKHDGFILTGNDELGNIETKEVYIVVKGLVESEQTFPTCNNNVDDDNDGYVDNDDATCESCVDNDDGIDISTASMALVTINPDMPKIAYVDSCNSGQLVEAVCFEDGTHFVTVACPAGQVCYRGACVEMDSDVLYTTYGDYKVAQGNIARIMQRVMSANSLAPGFKKKMNHVNRNFESQRKKSETGRTESGVVRKKSEAGKKVSILSSWLR